MNKAQLLDIGERAAWTLVQVSSAGAVVETLGLNAVYIAPLTLLFALIKNSLATKFGNGTASTLPISVEPLPPVMSNDGVAAVVTTLPETTPVAPTPEVGPNVTGP